VSVLDSPKLRWPLDVQRLAQDGNDLLLLRDQQGITPEPIVLPLIFAPILGKLDGEHSIENIVAECTSLGFSAGIVIQLVRELDELYLLESPRSRERREKMHDDFHRSPVRSAAFAGRLYPEDETGLRAAVADFCRRSGHPSLNVSVERPVVAMITPHIDYPRGWMAYAASQTILDAIPRPEVIFLFGTAHQHSSGLFHLTRKDFAGPFGSFAVDGELVSEIAKRFGEKRCFGEEILHRTEHSLELQLPFLSYRFSGEGLPRIVPILVGSFHHLLARQNASDGELDDFVGCVGEILRRLSGRKVLLYGGVDLAHMGRSFGDQGALSNEDCYGIEQRDREFLAAALSGDERAVFSHAASDLDRRRLCGFPSIYTMLAAMRSAGMPVSGRLVEYRQAFDRPSDCLVSFASAYWCA
jgi:AmmeMemoRadiSam system protein B